VQGLVFPIIMVAFIAMLYFSAIRPQKRRAQELAQILSQLKAGDEVITNSGIYGTVTEIEEGNTLLIEVAEHTEIRIARSAVAGLANPPQVVAQTSSPDTEPQPASDAT
jgi:preprotein translocase subunit YajC